tara:strand:+ start:1478 stop:2428 length:951 start_codon:yes stop_codon:yes gene_type:complete
LLRDLVAEHTDCFRLLHGAVEGVPGLTLDRYGSVLLAQTWKRSLDESDVGVIVDLAGEALDEDLLFVWNHRDGGAGSFARFFDFTEESGFVGRELGLMYDVRPRHRGADPLLFLDLRAGRRKVMEAALGKTVLNLFAYTCGLGLAAMQGGARQVLNLDFSASALEIGRANAARNGFDLQCFATLQADCLPALRQLAGLPVKGRASRRRSYVRLQQRRFDLVLLDPPAWSKSPFGAVDVVRDYMSLFKPALLATAEGGQMMVTNNSPRVLWDDWVAGLERGVRKLGRQLRSLDRIRPEADFPSPDGQSPLKVAWLEV